MKIMSAACSGKSSKATSTTWSESLTGMSICFIGGGQRGAGGEGGGEGKGWVRRTKEENKGNSERRIKSQYRHWTAIEISVRGARSNQSKEIRDRQGVISRDAVCRCGRIAFRAILICSCNGHLGTSHVISYTIDVRLYKNAF